MLQYKRSPDGGKRFDVTSEDWVLRTVRAWDHDKEYKDDKAILNAVKNAGTDGLKVAAYIVVVEDIPDDK